MITYTVHEPSEPPADRYDRADTLVFVKEGFTYAAAAFGPAWFLFKRQWLALLAYAVTIVAIVLGLAVLDAPAPWFMVASTALHLLVGFEADSIQRWTLGRRGYQMIGTVTGRNESECERRFLESWLPQQPMLSAGGTTSARGTLAGAVDGLTPVDNSSGGWRGLLRRS